MERNEKNKNNTFIQIPEDGDDDSDSSDDAIMRDKIKIAVENSLKTINQPPPSHKELPPSISQSPASSVAPQSYIPQPPPPPPPPQPRHSQSMISVTQNRVNLLFNSCINYRNGS